jgi:hypothetical protein
MMKRWYWWHVYVLRHRVRSDITAERLCNVCDCGYVWVWT